MAQIADMLQGLGFDKVGQLCISGNYRIIAEHDGASFCFEVDVAQIKAVLSKRTYMAQSDLQRRAENIAWRILYNKVKATCDVIKYQVETVGVAFGGYLTWNTKDGPIKLGDVMAKKIAEKKTSIGAFAGLLEDKS